MSGAYVVKGMRIRAQWRDAKVPPFSGVQLIAEGTLREVVGVVRHIRGDHPNHPTTVKLYVETQDGQGVPCLKCRVLEVEVEPRHVVEILK